MEISLDKAQPNVNQIKRYSVDEIVIGETSYQQSIIFSDVGEIKFWEPNNVKVLQAQHWQAVMEYSPEIILLGTGTRIEFPAPQLLTPLIEKKIGIEVMDTGAACRTFNLLVAEGRKVVAALMVG